MKPIDKMSAAEVEQTLSELARSQRTPRKSIQRSLNQKRTLKPVPPITVRPYSKARMRARFRRLRRSQG